MCYSTEEGTRFFSKRKMFCFLSCHVRGTKKKFSESPRGMELKRISRSEAIPLSHRDSTVSDVYYEINM